MGRLLQVQWTPVERLVSFEGWETSEKPPEQTAIPWAQDQLGTGHTGFTLGVPVRTLQTYFGKYFMFNNYKKASRQSSLEKPEP